jgi:hypothetical protein
MVSQVNRRLVSGRGAQVLSWGVGILALAAALLIACALAGLGGFAAVLLHSSSSWRARPHRLQRLGGGDGALHGDRRRRVRSASARRSTASWRAR